MACFYAWLNTCTNILEPDYSASQKPSYLAHSYRPAIYRIPATSLFTNMQYLAMCGDFYKTSLTHVSLRIGKRRYSAELRRPYCTCRPILSQALATAYGATVRVVSVSCRQGSIIVNSQENCPSGTPKQRHYRHATAWWISHVDFPLTRQQRRLEPASLEVAPTTLATF